MHRILDLIFNVKKNFVLCQTGIITGPKKYYSTQSYTLWIYYSSKELLTELIEKITASPAKIFGLYPKKGTILPGSDADLVIIDPTVEKDATPEITACRSDYCLHQGRKLLGWPVAVVKSGRIITRDSFEQVKDSIKARYLKRD